MRQEVRRCKVILEKLLGENNKGFSFGTIQKSNDNTPKTYLTGTYLTSGEQIVDIHISDFPWDNCSPDQGPWQVAHECVHLIDPVRYGEANMLEEGLATWFQCELEYQEDIVLKYIEHKNPLNDPNNPDIPFYIEARDLVLCIGWEDLAKAVKEIRKSGTKISEIRFDKLEETLKKFKDNVDSGKIKRLCEPFPYRFKSKARGA